MCYSQKCHTAEFALNPVSDMNNCICSEHQFTDAAMVRKIMEKSAAAVDKFNFD
eukprot:COSAG02_NODE_57701_length_279_cov_2.277778_2_plen_53_part_01